MTTSHSRRKRLTSLLAGCFLAAGMVESEAARANDGAVQQNFINQPSFFLPIQLEPSGRAVVSEIRVYHKKRPTDAWNYVTSCAPTQNGVPFTADVDGEHFFAMQLIDRKGQNIPANMSSAPANAIIVVDTQAPQVEIQTLSDGPEGQYYTVKVTDRHPDLTKLQFFYQTRDKAWRPQECVSNKPALFCVPTQANTTGMVRAVAFDSAGNSATKEINTAASKGPDAATPPQQVAGREPGILRVQAQDLPPAVPQKLPMGDQVSYSGIERVQKVDFPNQHPAVQSLLLPNLPQQPPTLPPTLIDPSRVPSSAANVAPTAPPTAAAKTPPASRKLINTPQLSLEYQIEKVGRSGVGKVEVWMTRDSQTWEKLAEDAEGKSPIQLKLPGDGLYGLTMVVSNGRGFGGQAPKAGDIPEGWVEVDSTRPTTEITEIRQGAGDDAGVVLISWLCKDRNLPTDPVDLFYLPEGNNAQWLPIAKNLRSEALFRWTPPATVGSQTLVRIVARDQAGNVSVLDTTQPILLDDLSRPRGRIFNITPSTPNGN